MTCFYFILFYYTKLTAMTSNANPSSTIILRVKHDPFAFQSKLLGCVEIEIFQLLELGEGKKGELFGSITPDIM